MWRTAIVSVLLLLCGYSAAAWITRDFQVWTDEARQPLLASPGAAGLALAG